MDKGEPPGSFDLRPKFGGFALNALVTWPQRLQTYVTSIHQEPQAFGQELLAIYLQGGKKFVKLFVH